MGAIVKFALDTLGSVNGDSGIVGLQALDDLAGRPAFLQFLVHTDAQVIPPNKPLPIPTARRGTLNRPRQSPIVTMLSPWAIPREISPRSKHINR
jgi:hypothetical protein